MGCSSSELSLGSLRPYSHLRQTWLGCTSTPVFELGDRTSAKCLIREEICSGRWGRGTLGVGNPCHFRESMRTIRETRRLSWPGQQGLIKIEHDLPWPAGQANENWFLAHPRKPGQAALVCPPYSVNRDWGHKVLGRVLLQNCAGDDRSVGLLNVFHDCNSMEGEPCHSPIPHRTIPVIACPRTRAKAVIPPRRLEASHG